MSSKVPCPKCNELNYPTDSVCLSCGARINAPARPVPEPSSAPPHGESVPDREARKRVIPWVAGGILLVIMVAVAIPLSMRSRGGHAPDSGVTPTTPHPVGDVTIPVPTTAVVTPPGTQPGGTTTPSASQPTDGAAPTTPYPSAVDHSGSWEITDGTSEGTYTAEFKDGGLPITVCLWFQASPGSKRTLAFASFLSAKPNADGSFSDSKDMKGITGFTESHVCKLEGRFSSATTVEGSSTVDGQTTRWTGRKTSR